MLKQLGSTPLFGIIFAANSEKERNTKDMPTMTLIPIMVAPVIGRQLGSTSALLGSVMGSIKSDGERKPRRNQHDEPGSAISPIGFPEHPHEAHVVLPVSLGVCSHGAIVGYPSRYPESASLA